MGDDGDDCMLNIFTSTSKKKTDENKKRKPDNQENNPSDPPVKKHKVEKNSNKGEEVKQKDRNKPKNPIKNKTGGGGGGGGGGDRKTKDAKSDRKKERGGAGHVLTKDRPFISNLFSKNPEIPAVEVTNGEVKAKDQKEVFSSSDVDGNPFKFHQRILSILKGQFDVKQFTQVQLAAIPKIAEGRDTLVKSQTGSGKTLAYALPIVHYLMTRETKVDRNDGPYAIVIVPTRELVIQGFETFNKLCAGCTWIVPGQLMGGEKKKSEKARLRKGINVLVATPGRLLDHLNTTETFQKQLPSLDFLVFDEADRLMDMGFEKDLNEIIAKIVELRGSKKRNLQSILASATLNDDVLRLVRLSLYDPVTIDTARMATATTTSGEKPAFAMTTPSTLRHHFLVCPHKLRLVALASFVLHRCRHGAAPAKIMIFVSTHKCVDFFVRLFDAVLNSSAPTDVEHDAGRATGVKWDPVVLPEVDDDSDDLERKPVAFLGLHGEMPQPRRTKTFRDFKVAAAETRRSSVLFCTDVGARGLDVRDVTWIVQFHPPGPPEDYVHRVGRSARAAAVGNALLFLTPSETGYVKYLREKADIPVMRETPLLRVLTDGLLPGAKRYLAGKGGGGGGEKAIKMEDAATCLQLKMENVVVVSTKNGGEGEEEDKGGEGKESDLSEKVASLNASCTAAYFSFIRAYSTYPKDVKQLGFNVKSLHFGHVAKSFALREPPSKMKDAAENVKEKKKKKLKEKGGKVKNRTKAKQLSEFSSGF